MESTFLSTAEAAELLHISQPTFRKRIREHGLETFRDPLDHRLRLLRAEDIERLRALEQLGGQSSGAERSDTVSRDTVPTS
jgi:excisionase family DNA binding protein